MHRMVSKYGLPVEIEREIERDVWARYRLHVAVLGYEAPMILYRLIDTACTATQKNSGTKLLRPRRPA